jgi:pimeloyl-ACP methyl ester carboxylesterase
VSTFVLIHGAGGGGWDWHLVEPELRARGHDVVAPDLPAGDDAAGLDDYVEVVVDAVGEGARRTDLVVVGHSYGGFTAPLVADRLGADVLVFVAGMIPAPGEAPRDWWQNVEYRAAVEAQAARDGGLTGNKDLFVSFYHDVPRGLAEESLRRERAHPTEAADNEPWPLERWPEVPTRVVIGTEDRFFPPDLLRRVSAERLGIVPDEIQSGHCVALSRPVELAEMLVGYAAEAGADRAARG